MRLPLFIVLKICLSAALCPADPPQDHAQRILIEQSVKLPAVQSDEAILYWPIPQSTAEQSVEAIKWSIADETSRP
jgi:hypothetical protein